MKIEWLSKQNESGAITIYNNNITLNKQAANFFMDAYCVAIGIDYDSKKLIIKSISKEEVESEGDSAKSRFHKLSIKKSYGRITGKQVINEISNAFKLDFDNNLAYKFSAKWNTGNRMLVVDTNWEKEERLNVR